MAETKKMHFVPKTYLKRFSQEKIKAGTKEYYVNALEKSKLDGQIENRNIRRICYEESMYEIPGTTEDERQIVEKMYNDLYEKDYDYIYKILTDDTKEIITAEERYSIIGFVVSMFYRNNSWHIFHNKVMDDTFERAYKISKFTEKESFFFEEQEVSIVGKTLDELQKENKVRDRPMIVLITAEKILQLTRWRVMNDVVTIIKKRGNFEFITSDNPVTFKGKDVNKKTIPFDAANSLWLPIDENHLLQLHPWAHELDWNRIGRLNDGPFPGISTSMSNAFQLQQAEKFLLGTENGLKAFQKNPNGIFPTQK